MDFFAAILITICIGFGVPLSIAGFLFCVSWGNDVFATAHFAGNNRRAICVWVMTICSGLYLFSYGLGESVLTSRLEQYRQMDQVDQVKKQQDDYDHWLRSFDPGSEGYKVEKKEEVNQHSKKEPQTNPPVVKQKSWLPSCLVDWLPAFVLGEDYLNGKKSWRPFWVFVCFLILAIVYSIAACREEFAKAVTIAYRKFREKTANSTDVVGGSFIERVADRFMHPDEKVKIINETTSNNNPSSSSANTPNGSSRIISSVLVGEFLIDILAEFIKIKK